VAFLMKAHIELKAGEEIDDRGEAFEQVLLDYFNVGIPGRIFHSSTIQVNLSRFRYITPWNQPAYTTKVLKVSRKCGRV